MTDVSSVLRVMKELQRTVGPAELNALKQRLDRAETKLDKAEAKLEAEQTKHVATRNQLKETQARNESNFLFLVWGQVIFQGGGSDGAGFRRERGVRVRCSGGILAMKLSLYHSTLVSFVSFLSCQRGRVG